ncbi:MAG: MoxR family ATPase, partial [Spirochaetes bacterium]|nr:MoxR family ATPase [Spirochaetota bacterium]
IKEIINTIHEIRKLPLKKDPSISETLDWAKALALLGCEVLNRDIAIDTLNFILKYEKDIELVKKNINTIIVH